MELVFLNTGYVFNMIDKKGIVKHLKQIGLVDYIPTFKRRSDQYIKLTKEDYFEKYLEMCSTRANRRSRIGEEYDFLEMVEKKHPAITKLLKRNKVIKLPGVDNFFLSLRRIKQTNIFSDNLIHETHTSVSPVRVYEYLQSLSFLRNEGIYEMEQEFIQEIWNTYPDYFLCTTHTDKDGKIESDYDIHISMLKKFLIREFKKKYPFRYKYYRKEEDSACNESKHGLIHGLIHRLSHTNLENMISLTNEGWLDPFYSNTYKVWKSGVYMKLMTDRTQNKREGLVNFVFSVALLDDLDYYGNDDEAFGDRTGHSFYKGVSHKVPKELKKYSSAERAVIYNMEHGEIIFREPISLERYLEKILVPEGRFGDEFMTCEDIPKYYRDMMVKELEPDVYYRKNCNGEMEDPSKSSKILKKYEDKLSDEKIPQELIPDEDMIELVKRERVELIEGDVKRMKEIPFEIISS